MECFGVEPPGVRAVIDRAAANASGKGPVEGVARVDNSRRRLRVRPHRADFRELRAEGRGTNGARKTLSELRMAEAPGPEPRASFEQQHVPARRCQLFGDHAAAGSRSNDDSVRARVFRAHSDAPVYNNRLPMRMYGRVRRPHRPEPVEG